MHIQRIILLVISALLIFIGLFVTMISNYPDPGQNLTVPLLALFGLITGILAIIGNKKKLIGIWSKIIITVVGVFITFVGIRLPHIADLATQEASSNASSSSDPLADVFSAAGDAARMITNTQPQPTNAIFLVIFIGLAFIVSAWVFNFTKKTELTS